MPRTSRRGAKKSRAHNRRRTIQGRRGRLVLSDLDHLIAEELPIYVTNTSEADSVTLIMFNNPANGDVIPHQVPAQQVPWCLTDFLSRDIIGGSTDLRKYLADGNLSVLDPDFAAEMAENPRTSKLLSRLRSQTTGKKKRRNRGKVNREVIQLDPRVESIMARLTSNKKSKADQQAAIEALELIEEHLDQPEFAHILQTAPDCKLVTAWAVEAMGSDIEGMEIDPNRPAPRRARRRPSREPVRRAHTETAKKRRSKSSSQKSKSTGGVKLNSSQKDQLRYIQSRLKK